MAEEESLQPPLCEGGNQDVADADAVVRFGATRDRMKLCVSCYSPARGAGAPLSLERLAELLLLAGVRAELDREAAARAVALLLAGRDARSVAIARGLRPLPSRDAWVEPLGDLNFPVFPGQTFGRLHPPEPALPGRDVTGEAVPPTDQRRPRNIDIPPDAGCVLTEDGLLTATACGLVRVSDTQVRLEPVFRVAEDLLSVTAALYPHDALGLALTARRVQEELSRMGVAVGVRLGRVEESLSRAREAGAAVEGVVVARGRPPEHGRDGYLELYYTERENVGTVSEGGRIDWRDRGFSPVVEEGSDIARLHPPTEGVPGQDVFGDPVPPRPGKPLVVRPGRNVEVAEAGMLFRSRITGVVLAGKGALDVSELLDVGGDVDYATGNIRLAHGSVRIKGTVRSGFEVAAPGSVLVDGVVEDARVEAGGDVAVRGGIFMSGETPAFIRAGGGVSAAYTHNARIMAGGDVTIAHYITCGTVQAGYRVHAGGRVRVTDAKGKIMGGLVICAEGLEVFEAGSPMGVTTVLAVSRENPELRELMQEKRRLRALVDRVNTQFGEGPPEAALERVPAERREEALSLLADREKALGRLKEVRRTLAEQAQSELGRGEGARIVIRGVAHPGVVIKMGGRSLHVDRPLERGQFFWNAERREIVVAGL